MRRINRFKQYGSDTSFKDLLFNCLLVFVFLFTMAYMMVKPEQKDANIKTKAEFVVTTVWPDESKDDVDIWIRDPIGNTLCFKSKDVGFMHLDRDDLGSANDTITLPDGTKMNIKTNQELVTIRGFLEGEWIINVHMYSKRDKTPTEIQVKVEKMNPTIQTVYFKRIVMKEKWDEATVIRFTMDSNGKVTSIDRTPISLIESDVNTTLDDSIRDNYNGPHHGL